MTFSEDIQHLSLNIGPYTLHSIPTGLFWLDGGAMFGIVPKVLWEKTNPSDDQNRILMECRALLLKSSERNILIDTGNGGDFKAKYGDRAGTRFESIYGMNSQGVSLLSSLKKQGLNPEDITDVILTHLHFDHAGGATCEKGGRLQPTFPQATYYVQEDNLKTAQHPNRRERASYLKPNFEPLIEHHKLQTLKSSDQSLWPHISLSISHGHTQAQQNILISDESHSIFYCADLIPTSTHIRLAWIMGYDLDPLTLIDEKEALLKKATEGNWYLFFEHDPYCDAATVQFNGRDYEFQKRFHLC